MFGATATPAWWMTAQVEGWVEQPTCMVHANLASVAGHVLSVSGEAAAAAVRRGGSVTHKPVAEETILTPS